MTHFPPSQLHEKRRRALRWIGISLSALMVVTVLIILGLIVRNEWAHDEATCPFVKRSERAFASGRVIEEERTCVSDISERRYLLERTGQPAYELARKRLTKGRFDDARYRWELDEDGKQRVLVRILVDGKLSSEFREEDATRP
jgi:hypothetical protein